MSGIGLLRWKFLFFSSPFVSFLVTTADLKAYSPFSTEDFGSCSAYTAAVLSVTSIASFSCYITVIIFRLFRVYSSVFSSYPVSFHLLFIPIAMDRSNGLVSRQGSISHMPWPSETSAFTSHLRQCSAEAAMERQLGFDRSHPPFSSYFFQLSGQDGRDAIREQQMTYPTQQQINAMAASTAATTASRGLASSNWRTFGQDGSSFTRASPHAHLGAHATRQGDASRIPAGAGPVSSPGGVDDGYAYYLNRGDGQVTRLIPADVLPSLNEIPPRELEQRGMIVLPLPRGARPNGMADMNFAVTVKVSKFLLARRRTRHLSTNQEEEAEALRLSHLRIILDGHQMSSRYVIAEL